MRPEDPYPLRLVWIVQPLRVEVKHRGTLPNQHDVTAFQATVTEFLSVATRDLFGVDFDDISLSALVRSERVRSELSQAETGFQAEDAKNALEHAALAFHYAMDGFRFGDPPRSWDKRLYNPTNTTGLPFHGAADERFANKIVDALNRIDDAITVVAYNLDYDGYRYLMTFGPMVIAIFDAIPRMEWTIEPTKDQRAIKRCIDFAID